MGVRVSLVGSTGSIGTQTLDVLEKVNAQDPGAYEVAAIGAYRSVTQLAEQARRCRPERVAIGDASLAAELEDAVPTGTEVLAGEGALAEIAKGSDVVVNAVVGFAGLPVTVAALRSGSRLALANKESLVAGGPVVQKAMGVNGAHIVPVDSEHCAVHQCLRSGLGEREVARIVLTASGGPFRGRNSDDLEGVSVNDALTHPTWNMGPKITIDSSTLMNKGLEVIEAHELFGIDYDRIEVVVHPQSIVHSMVEFVDGATIAQLSYPDMRLPIGYAIGYPARVPVPFGALDWTKLSSLDFGVPDRSVFRCLDLAYTAGRTGGSAPAWLNAANEVAVEAFLGGEIPWKSIASVVEKVLESHEQTDMSLPEEVVEADHEARSRAVAVLNQFRP